MLKLHTIINFISDYSDIASGMVQSYSHNRFKSLGWHNIGWDQGTWVLSLVIPMALFLIAVIVVVIAIQLRTTAARKVQKRQNDERQYAAAIERFGLDTEMQTLITQLHRHAPNESVNTIVEDVAIFERCLDAELALLSARLLADELTDKATLFNVLRRKLGFHLYPPDKQLCSTRAITLGQICTIFSAENNQQLIKKASVTVVSELSMRLKFNPADAEIAKLKAGTPVRLAFCRDNDGFYGAQVHVFGLPMDGTIELGHTIQLKRSQLRKFVRVNIATEIKCRMLKPANPDSSSLAIGQSITANMYDISGGGLAFKHSQCLQSGDIVSLSFNIGGSRISGLQGTILRTSERNVKGAKEYNHHVKFNAIEMKDQEKIVKFAFEQMRMLTQWNMRRSK